MPPRTRRRKWPQFAEWARKEGVDLAGQSSRTLEQANKALLVAVERISQKRTVEAEALILRAMHLLSEARVNQEKIQRYLTEALRGIDE